jgi:zinc transporter 1
LVATDDHENDETFRPPVPPTSSVLGCDERRQQALSHERDAASQMNMRGVFLHVLADALGSFIVIASASVSTSVRIRHSHCLCLCEYKLRLFPLTTL